MYENLAYEEIRNLPEDQKAEAWKELHSQFSNKELAQKLGVAPIAVVNAVKKYVLGEPIGRANKKDKPELQSEQREQPEKSEQTEERPRRKYNRKPKPELVIDLPDVDKSESQKQSIEKGSESFSVTIHKTVSGEGAQTILNGLASTLIKNQQYNIELKITE